MKKILKKGLCLLAIYLIATGFIFLMSERITKLDTSSTNDFRNTNGSLSVTLKK